MNGTHYTKEFCQLVPQIFAVETILGCDLKCPECAVGGNFIKRRKGQMTFTQFKIIADKIQPFCKHLYLHLWGEPMLNKDIFKMIQYASNFTTTNISTNGNSITEEKAKRLIQSGVTDIIISIDGVSDAVYSKYRVNGDVKKSLETLRLLQYFNVKYGNRVTITPQFIVMKHNQHEMDDFRKLCGQLNINPNFKSPYIRNHHSHFSASDMPEYKRPCYPNIFRLREAMTQCGSIRKAFNILVDGSVVGCCHDYQGNTHFGNIFDKDVQEIWDSTIYQDFRWSVFSGKAPKFCVNHCMSYFLEKSPDRFTNDERNA